MSRKDTPRFEGARPSAILERVEQAKEVQLILPPSHPKQAELINAFDARKDPEHPELGPIYNESYPGFYSLPKFYPDLRFLAGACGSKFGKLELLTNEIPTPSGWRTMGDLQVGDHVFDDNGVPTKIVYTTDVMHGLKCYEVVFADGAKVVVGADHLWLTETHSARKNQARANNPKDRCKSTASKAEVRDTEEIKRTLHSVHGGKTRPNHSIPVCQPVQYPYQYLSVDPYILGAWLGDGTSTSGNVTGVDEEVLNIIGTKYRRYMTPSQSKRGQTWSFEGLAYDLRTLGVLGNKHVPAQYLIGSSDQRIAILQGLMDTDGTISKRGDCTFDNTNKALADAVSELASSLGIKVNRQERYGKLNGVAKKLCYRVHFTTDLPVFRIRRKLARIRPLASKAKRRYIVAVNDVPSAPAKCIRVESPRHLYLTGRSYIVTHNTYGCSIRIAKEAWDNPGSLNWWVAPSYKQAEIAYRLVKRLIPKSMYHDYKADLRLELLDPDGNHWSDIEFKSADNDDNLRGFAVNFFVLDEAARISRAAYDSVMTTTTQTDGRGIIISTPKGRGWFYDEYQKGEKAHLIDPNDDEYPEWLSIRMPTWENPTVKPSRIMTLRKNMPKDVFEQEIAARFLLESAGVFRGIQGCVKRGLLDAKGSPLWEDPIPGRRYVMGVDLARKRDYSVIMVFDTVRKLLVYYDRFNALEWAIQKARIVSTAKKFRARVYMDGTGLGDPIVSDVRNAGVSVEPYIISPKSKQPLIEKLRVAIEFGNVSFPLIPVVIRELERYEYNINSNGNISYSSPAGQHDDTVIAMALANWGMGQTPLIYRAQQVRGI